MITIGIIVQIIAIPLIAFLMRFLVKKLKFKDTSYKKALIVTAIYIIAGYIAEILLNFIFFNNDLIQGIGLLIIAVSIWIFTIKKFYKVDTKQSLILFLYYHIAIFIIAVVVAIIGVIIFNFIEPLISPPTLVMSGCHNHCIEFSNYASYEVKKEEKVAYTCYCILDNGDKIKTIQFPVDFDYKALEENMFKGLPTISEEELMKLNSMNEQETENKIQDALEIDKVRTYSIYNNHFATFVDYDVKVTKIDVEKELASFDINGQEIEDLSVNETAKLLDESNLGVISFFYDNDEAMVEFYLSSS